MDRHVCSVEAVHSAMFEVIIVENMYIAVG